MWTERTSHTGSFNLTHKLERDLLFDVPRLYSDSTFTEDRLELVSRELTLPQETQVFTRLFQVGVPSYSVFFVLFSFVRDGVLQCR